jgi:nicotinamide-nucleotide amidase
VPQPSCIDPDLVERASGVVGLLAERKLTVVTAESCTAGLIAAALSHGDGASDVLHGGFVTYTKAQKTSALGVDAGVLADAGSVNARVAIAMARGALARSPAEIALAVTGVLGPKPDEDGNPVGLVYFCCARRGGAPTARERWFTGEPDQIRHAVVLEAFDIISDAARGSHQS